MKISSLGLTEDIEGEPKKWSLWIGNTVHMAVVLHTFEAKTVEAKESWVNAIKEVLEAEGGQKTSRHGKSQSGKQGPALKEKLVTGDGYEDILREVEKQYVIITAPKVAPKPKIRSESLTGSNGVQPKITKSPQYIRAKPGENVVFTCEFTGDPEPAVTWTKNEIPIKDYGRFSIVVQKGYSELSIENIANEDAGQYQIILKNSFGAAWAAGILDMNVPPHMTDPPKGVIGKVGGAALFPCKFEASPQPSITWSKGDVVLESEGRFQIVIDEGFTKLEIDDLQKSDAGNYKVVLKNPAGSEWASAGLVVTRSAEEKDNKIVSSTISEELVPIEDQGSFCTPTVGPSEITSSPQITTAPKGVVAKLGTNVVFSCGYSGDPEPTVTWNKDGNIIESKGRIQIVTKPGSSHVEIDEIVKDDGGVYQIVLKNQWGYAWASAQLVITGDKKPPNITEAPKGQVVKVGGAVVFPCKFEAIPQPNITWSKNNVVIENEGRFEIVIEEGFTKLEIDDLLKSDAGNYKVLLENSAGSAWASAGLVVTGGEEKKGDEERTIGTQKNRNAEMVDGEVPEQSLIIENLKDEHVHKWTALTLTAKVKSSGVKPKITWKKDGKNVAIGRARATYDKGVVTLKIMRAEVNDAGVYTVEIESGSQKCESTATVEIIDPNKANKPNGPSAAKPSFLDKFKPQATIESSQSSVEKHSPEKEETPTKNEGISIENNASEQVNGIVEGEVAGQASEESFLIEKLQDQEVNKWTALTLTCKVKNSGPKPKITWKKDGKTLGMGRARAAYDKGVATLKIMRAEPHDAGTYTVEIESELKGCQSSATVKVTDAPKAPKKSDGPVVNKGAFLSKYKPPPATKSSDSALKENASAQEESSQKEENTSKENKNISPKENDPTKQEKASNTNAEPQKSEVNDVKDEVESKEAGQSMLIENLQDQQVKKAAPLTLVAKLKDSDAKPKIVWKKDGKTVGMGRARATYDKGVATLKIMRTEFNDAGVYTIEIESGSEKYESTATVEIADVPEPPFPPTASEITPNSAKITWRASKDGNAPISSYLLEYRANADKDWTTVVEEITTTSFVVQDLSPKTGYRFRVSAINKKGTSKPSRLSGIVETKV